MGEEAPSSGDLAELEAPVAVEVFGGELGKGRCRIAGIGTEHGSKIGCRDGLARDQEQGLEGPFERITRKTVQTLHDHSPLDS